MTIQYPAWSLTQEAAQLAVRQQLAADKAARLDFSLRGRSRYPHAAGAFASSGCEHLRHLLIGSPAGVQEAIARLHLLDYVERHYWTPLIQITSRGIHITPAQGQVLSYLVQQRSLR